MITYNQIVTMRIFTTLTLLLATSIFLSSNSYGGPRELDYAVQDSAYETIKAMTNRSLEPMNVAFLPFPNDFQDISSVFRAELSRYPGPFTFITSNPPEYELLVAEIEKGVRKGDIMDPLTIPQFGRIKGVGAVLLGSIRELSDSEAEAIARFSLVLRDVETWEVLWSGNVEGVVRPEPELVTSKALSQVLLDLAGKAQQRFESDMREKGKYRIYPLAMMNDNLAAMEVVLPYLVRGGGNDLQFFSAVAGQKGRRTVNKIASELSNNGLSELQNMALIIRQVLEGDAAAATPRSDGFRDAVLFGRIRQADVNDDTARVVLSMTVAEMETGQILWGDTFDAETAAPEQTFLDKVYGLMASLGIPEKALKWVLIAIIGIPIILFLFFKLLGAMTRVR